MAAIPQVRRREFPFGPQVPRAWFGGSPSATALANGLNLVFPSGERFFIRSVRHYQDRVVDPELRARIAGFVGQEAQHQRAHLAAFAMLEAQGYEVASWLQWYERMGYEVIEPRTPTILRLATTAALEHLTATFGELALATEMLDDVDPLMRDLLRWHAAEEIEHRDVAYEVLQAVDGRWVVRAAGFGIAVTVLAVFWSSGTRHLRRQEPPRPRKVVRAEHSEVRAYWRRNGARFGKAVLAYLRPGFHPREMGGDALAEAYLSELAARAANPA